MPDEAALAGLRVVDLTTGVAGPFGTKLLADFGAEVIKVEPPGGDPARRLPPFAQDTPGVEASLLFAHLNTNKRSVALDLENAAGRAALRALAARADLLIENLPVGTLERLGLGFGALAATNPRLCLLSFSDFGQTGPACGWRGGELVIEAVSGLMHSEGEPSREPLRFAGYKAQYVAGAYLATAALAALRARDRDGRGYALDVSNWECLLNTPDQATRLMLWEYARDEARRNGYRRPGSYLFGVYACADGYVLFSGGGLDQWHRIARMLERPDLLHATRFTDPAERIHHADEFEAIVWGWCADRTVAEVVAAAQAAHVACVPMNAPHQVAEDPHFRARGAFVALETPHGTFAGVGPPLRAPRLGWRAGRAPRLGEHNRAVLTGLLGLTAGERKLLSPGATVRRPGWRGRALTLSLSQRERGSPSLDPGRRTTAPGLPLKGVRVLDHGQVFAIPAAAAILAGLGAEVIRIEAISHFPRATRGLLPRPPKPSLGYPDRDPGERPWNRYYYNVNQLNKLSATFELKDETSRALYFRLLATADVVLDNFAVGVMPRLGLSYEALRRVRPDIIALSATGFGQDGPYRHYVTYGSGVDSICGHTYLRGYPGDDPLIRTSQTWPDSATSATVAFAVLAALHQRDRTGEGQFIDLAESEMFLAHTAEALLDWTANRRSRRAIGNAHEVDAPHNVYPCAGEDNWLVIAVTSDEAWAGLRRVMGEPAWAADRRFDTALGRRRYRAALDAQIAAWTVLNEAEALMNALQAAGVAAARVLRPSQILDHPQHATRGYIVPIHDPECGTHRYPLGPWRWDGSRLGAPRPAAALGEHNRYVYGELLGLREDKIADLEARRLIGTTFLAAER